MLSSAINEIGLINLNKFYILDLKRMLNTIIKTSLFSMKLILNLDTVKYSILELCSTRHCRDAHL